MDYITRDLERKFLKLNDFFKVILVTGARQVGKTTMLKHLSESDRTYVTMDNAMARELAQTDPVLFFQTYKTPILIDEIQKAPELFEQIKIICDESDETGLIWLTGSQQYGAMKKVRETLAGRIGILELYSLSAREKAGLVFDTELDFSLTTLQARQRKLPKNDVIQVFNHIWKGGMPQVQQRRTVQDPPVNRSSSEHQERDSQQEFRKDLRPYSEACTGRKTGPDSADG